MVAFKACTIQNTQSHAATLRPTANDNSRSWTLSSNRALSIIHLPLIFRITLLVLNLPLYAAADTTFTPRSGGTQDLIIIDKPGRAIAVDVLGNLLLLARSGLGAGTWSGLWGVRSGGLGRRVGGGIEVGLAGDILLLPRVQAVFDSFGCAFWVGVLV